MVAAVDVDLVSGDSYINILIAGFFINLAGDLFVHYQIKSTNHLSKYLSFSGGDG